MRRKVNGWAVLKTLLKNDILFFMVIMSAVLLNVATLAMCKSRNLELSVTLNHPLFASLLLDETKEDASPDDADEPMLVSADASGEPAPRERNVVIEQDAVASSSGKSAASGDSDASGEGTAIDTDAILAQVENGVTAFVKYEKTKTHSAYYSDPGMTALTTKYEYETVGNNYFKNALFIGDSRVEGLQMYGKIDTAKFICHQGYTTDDLLTEQVAKVDGKSATLAEYLKSKKFGKVYIMVGINELGIGNTSDYAKRYAKLLKMVRKYEPDSVIYIMGIMRVTKAYEKNSDYINNVNINDKNVAIAKMADGEKVFYIDMNTEFINENGYIKPKYTWDGVHLQAEYYDIWVNFIKSHAVVEKKEKPKTSGDASGDVVNASSDASADAN